VRILGESLTNVLRHSQATHVAVSLREEESSITLKIADNGIGFSDEQLVKPSSFGILGMKERVYPWKGEVRTGGSKDGGATITVMIPNKE